MDSHFEFESACAPPLQVWDGQCCARPQDGGRVPRRLPGRHAGAMRSAVSEQLAVGGRGGSGQPALDGVANYRIWGYILHPQGRALAQV